MSSENLDNPKTLMRIAMSILLNLFNQKEISSKKSASKVINEMIRLLGGEVGSEN